MTVTVHSQSTFMTLHIDASFLLYRYFSKAKFKLRTWVNFTYVRIFRRDVKLLQILMLEVGKKAMKPSQSMGSLLQVAQIIK